MAFRLYHGTMQPVLSLESSKSLDHQLIARFSLSESKLIDGAAEGIFRLTEPMIHGRILIAAGPGNNGSDGLALANILARHGYDVDVLLPYGNGNKENMRRRSELHASVGIARSAEGYDTIYDALFGFGYHGEADGNVRSIASSIPKESTVIAVDVPSAGLIRAEATVALMSLKDVLFEPEGRHLAGKVMLHNPGFPEAELKESPDGIYLLSDSDSSIRGLSITDYKNTRGHVAIIGGSDRYTGAPRLSARAAFFSGAGLVTIVTHSAHIRDCNPAVMIEEGEGDFSRFSSFVIGPGWDSGDEAHLDKATATGRPAVLDADALRFVPGRRFFNRAVLTPHIGEYRRLMASLSIPDGLGDAASLASSLRRLATDTESVVVLKSSVVWITDGSDIFIYDGCNPSLGVAGSGDVLAGIIGALLAEGEDPLRAAIDGVILHQRAGRSAHERYGFYSAEELIEETGRCR